jgi:hypothetical protein
VKKQGAGQKPGILAVEILEAKPNPMFTEEQRAAIRFLRYNRTVPCAECGKRRKGMWTMLCAFRAYDFYASVVVLQTPEKTHAPLTPVCSDHPLGPAWPKGEKEQEEDRC